MAEITVEVSLSGKQVLLKKGSELIAMDINGNNVHIWATSRNGGRTVVELEFREDEVASIASYP